METKAPTDTEQNEIDLSQDKELYIRLGEARQRILTAAETSEKTRADKFLSMGTYIGIAALIGIFLLLITGYLLQFAGLLPSPIGGRIILIVFGILLSGSILGVFAIFGSFLLSIFTVLTRNEIDRAQETYKQTSKYTKEGQASFGDFDLATLTRAAERIENQLANVGTATSYFDSVLKYLPTALLWLIILLLALFLFDPQVLTNILNDPQVNSLALFQEKISSHVFTTITSSFHPFAIFNILMLALIFTAWAKITPVLINLAAARRARRYRDYLNILKEAKELKKLTPEEAIASATPKQLPSPPATEAFSALREKAINPLPKRNGTGNKSRKRK